MAQTLTEPRMQLELHRLSSNAKVSIFDDCLPRPEVSQAGVIARVATAAKTWQRHQPADATAQQDTALLQSPYADDVTGQGSLPSSSSDMVGGSAQDHSSAEDVSRLQYATGSTAAADSVGTTGPRAAPEAAAAGYAAVGGLSLELNHKGSSLSTPSTRLKVDFAEPRRVGAAGAGTTGPSDAGEVERGQAAAAADLRGQAVAGRCRCVGWSQECIQATGCCLTHSVMSLQAMPHCLP